MNMPLILSSARGGDDGGDVAATTAVCCCSYLVVTWQHDIAAVVVSYDAGWRWADTHLGSAPSLSRCLHLFTILPPLPLSTMH
jgi:hypothetical protein